MTAPPTEPRKSQPSVPPLELAAKSAGLPVAASAAQRRALGFSALIAVVSLVVLSLPVASGLFLGTLLAFSLLRAYEKLAQRLRRPDLAAVLLSLASAVAIIGLLTVFFYFVIARGIVAANTLARGFGPDGPLRALIMRIDEVSRSTPIGPIDLAGHVQEAAASAASKLTSWAAALAGATLNAALLLFFTIMTTYFVLRHWPELVKRAERLSPLHPAHTRSVLAEFQRVGEEVFIGTLLTGLAQGVLAGIGYAIAGAPEAALLGALTAICSLVPAIGTLLVWAPVGVGLTIAGHVFAGIFVLVWGALIVGVVCDYVIRPRLVGGTGHVPTLVTFISLFGGVAVFGLLGLIVGPVIASVALALLQTYDREICNEQDAAAEPPK
jgi:predicted PurR-regulated permease PerM